MTSPRNSHQRIADAFDAWWRESYPMAPANAQARERFVAFGVHLEHQLLADMFPAQPPGYGASEPL